MNPGCRNALAMERSRDVGACCALCRWSEVTRHLELWVQLMELNEAGEFTAVEVLPAKDVCTGGVFQLRQVTGPLVFVVSTFVHGHWLMFIF